MAKKELPEHVSNHLRRRGVDVGALSEEDHNTLADLSTHEVNALGDAAATLDKLSADNTVKMKIV